MCRLRRHQLAGVGWVRMPITASGFANGTPELGCGSGRPPQAIGVGGRLVVVGLRSNRGMGYR
ncbi:hypothetical protein GCM10010353_64280 [Streptomyces chryseus]|nr:hypothetical protein GCM10010353_64280 [Streptomyces chryseus]